MKENEFSDENSDENDEQEFAELGALKTSAPDDILMRLQKRMRTAQLGKDLVERQAFAFWAVIDAFLKLIFVPNKQNKENQTKGEK